MLELRRYRQRAVGTGAYLHYVFPQAAFVVGVRQQVFGEQAVQVQQGEAVEADGVHVVHQELDGGLVVQDHLRLDGRAAGRFAGFLDQSLGIEPAVGVSFQPAGRPREVDQQAADEVAAIGSRGKALLLWRQLAHALQSFPQRLRQVRCFVGAVAEQDFLLIGNRLACRDGLLDVGENLLAGRGQRDFAMLREQIASRPASARRGDEPLRGELREPTLRCPSGDVRMPSQNLGKREPAALPVEALQQLLGRFGHLLNHRARYPLWRD